MLTKFKKSTLSETTYEESTLHPHQTTLPEFRTNNPIFDTTIITDTEQAIRYVNYKQMCCIALFYSQ